QFIELNDFFFFLNFPLSTFIVLRICRKENQHSEYGYNNLFHYRLKELSYMMCVEVCFHCILKHYLLLSLMGKRGWFHLAFLALATNKKMRMHQLLRFDTSSF